MKKNKIKIYNQKIIFSKSDMLPDDFINRIIKYKEKIKDVEKTDLNELIMDFNNDMYPEIELMTWETLANKYESIIKDNTELNLKEKKNIFEELLLELFGE